MTSDSDIYRAAKLLIDQHGLKGASEHAADRIADLWDDGDQECVRTWGKIRAALLDLSDVRLRDDETH